MDKVKTTLQCLAVSTAIHVLFFMPNDFGCSRVDSGSGSGSGSSNKNEKGSGSSDKVKITIIERAKGKGDKAQCKDGYGGIGVRHNYDGIITEVFKGYPAEHAGIKVNDIIVGQLSLLRGEQGSVAAVTVLRNGKEMVFNIVREKICTVEQK